MTSKPFSSQCHIYSKHYFVFYVIRASRDDLFNQIKVNFKLFSLDQKLPSFSNTKQTLLKGDYISKLKRLDGD